MLTKRHFEDLAEHVRTELMADWPIPKADEEAARGALAEFCAEFCAAWNPRFDRKTFLAACVPEQES